MLIAIFQNCARSGFDAKTILASNVIDQPTLDLPSEPEIPPAEGVPFSGKTYWVSATGPFTTNCQTAQGESDPGIYLSTINAGAACMAGEDRLNVKPGTYPENLLNAFPSGASWDHPTVVRSTTPGGAVLNSGNSSGFIFNTPGHKYVVIDGFRLSPGLLSVAEGARSVRFQNGYISTNSQGVNCYKMDQEPYTTNVNCEIINSELANNADSPEGHEHAIYVTGGGHIFRGNKIHGTTGGYGIHLISGSCTQAPCIIEKNIVFSNGLESGGIITQATGAIIRNNVVYNESGAHAGIRAGATATIVNNTIYNCTNGIKLDEGAHSSTIKNNIVRATRAGGADILILTNNNVITHNTISSAGVVNDGTGNNLSDNTNADPLFEDPQNANFTVKAGSPIIDSGVDVGLPFRGSAPDRGAIEF